MDNLSQMPPMAPPMSVEELNAAIPAAVTEPVFPGQTAPDAPPLPEINLANEVSQGAAQVKDYLMQPAAGGPSLAPTPAPVVVAPPVAEKVAAPAQKAQLSEPFKAAITPSETEIQTSLSTQAAPVRRMVADATAKNLANAELSKFMDSERKRQEEIQAQVQQLEEKTNNEVRAKSFSEIIQNGSFGQRILAVLAVGMGAAARATGSAENPALRVIDQAVQQQAQKDKLNFEQKLSLKKQLIESSQNIIQAAQGRFTNENTQQNLQLQYDKLNAEREKASMELQASFSDTAAADMLLDAQIPSPTGVQGTPEEIKAIEAHNAALRRNIKVAARKDPKGVQKYLEKLIVLPNKKLKPAPANIGQINKFNEARSDIEGAKLMIQDIKDTAGSGKVLNLKDIERLQSHITALTGRLRLSYLGPGAMTQEEYNRLYKAIGNPGKALSIPALELAKLSAVEDNLDVDLEQRARNIAGLDEWPLSKRQQIIGQFRARGANPREAAERADALIKKMGGG